MANLNIRVPEGFLEDIDSHARKYGMNRTQFVLKAVEILSGFEESFFKDIQQKSEGLKLPEYLVIQNMAIKVMAERAAKLELYGVRSQELDEFKIIQEGSEVKTITGEQLFDSLKKDYLIKEKTAKARASLSLLHLKQKQLELESEE